MKNLFSFIKKFMFLFLISTSGLLLGFSPINLRLENKPHYISTYDWCKIQAREFVIEKRKPVLQFLEITETEFEKRKIKISQLHKEAVELALQKRTSNDPITQDIIWTINKVMGNHHVKDALSEKKINFYVINESSNLSEQLLATDGFNIFINPEKIRNYLTTENQLEACVLHEIGHIVCNHNLELYCITTICIEKFGSLSGNNQKIFDNFNKDYIKATEIEADIIAIFGYMENAKHLMEYFGLFPITKTEPRGHPSAKQREDCMKEIYKYMTRDTKTTNKKLTNNIKPIYRCQKQQRSPNLNIQHKKYMQNAELQRQIAKAAAAMINNKRRKKLVKS